jgi:hypothetical protein
MILYTCTDGKAFGGLDNGEVVVGSEAIVEWAGETRGES